MTTPQGKIEIAAGVTQNVTLVSNFGQNVLAISIDRLELCLVRNRESLTRSTDWRTPLGLVLAVAATFTTADFKSSALGLGPDAWKLGFILAGLYATYALLRAFWATYQVRQKNIEQTIIDALCKDGTVTRGSSETDSGIAGS